MDTVKSALQYINILTYSTDYVYDVFEEGFSAKVCPQFRSTLSCIPEAQM